MDRDKLRRQIEGALIDNGGLDVDLMTRCTEEELAEFITKTIWPEIERLRNGLTDAIACIHALEDQQAMPDDSYLPLLHSAQETLDGS